jgi:hypothetical protein
VSDPAWKRVSDGRKQVAASEEADLRGREQTRMKKERLKRLLGKKTPPDHRANPEVDRQIFEYLQYVLVQSAPVALAGRWRPGVIYRGITKDQRKQETYDPNDLLSQYIDPSELDGVVRVWVPEWRHTGPRLKTLAWIMSMSEFGDRARTLNLNLGIDVINMAKAAQQGRRIGFARYIRDRITKKLKAALAPYGVTTVTFFFWVEARQEAEAHLHGVIVMPDHPEAAKVERTIRDALKDAGGDWNPSAPENQLELKKMYDPLGWAGYISKWRLLSQLHLQDGNTVAATRDIRSKARDWYVAARKSGDPIN